MLTFRLERAARQPGLGLGRAAPGHNGIAVVNIWNSAATAIVPAHNSPIRIMKAQCSEAFNGRSFFRDRFSIEQI